MSILACFASVDILESVDYIKCGSKSGICFCCVFSKIDVFGLFPLSTMWVYNARNVKLHSWKVRWKTERVFKNPTRASFPYDALSFTTVNIQLICVSYKQRYKWMCSTWLENSTLMILILTYMTYKIFCWGIHLQHSEIGWGSRNGGRRRSAWQLGRSRRSGR